MASSRRTGTNESISTYDSAGGKDYTALNTWEAATDNDNVADTVSPVLECYKGAHDDDTVMTGATNNANYFRIVRPASGEGHSGIPLTDGTIAAFVKTAYVPGIFKVQDEYDQVQDLVLDITTNTTNFLQALRLASNNVAAVGILIKRCENTYALSPARGIRLSDASGNKFVINCMVHAADDPAFIVSAGTGYFYNCTEFECGLSIEVETGTTANTVNCVLDDATSVSGTLNQTTNTTDTPTYVNSSGDDFHLDSSDTTAKDNGTDLSSDGVYAFDDDIDGDTRSGSWDIGFDELTGAPPAGIVAGSLSLMGVGV